MRRELANKFKDYLRGDHSLEVALLGCRGGGRHSDPRTQSAEEFDNELALAAVLTAEREGYKGEAKFERAQALLLEHRFGKTIGVDRLRQLKGKRYAYLRPGAETLVEIDFSFAAKFKRAIEEEHQLALNSPRFSNASPAEIAKHIHERVVERLGLAPPSRSAGGEESQLIK